jgi:hypothetical protein
VTLGKGGGVWKKWKADYGRNMEKLFEGGECCEKVLRRGWRTERGGNLGCHLREGRGGE